jgi:polyhydroxyalkanoate synthesis regulator phasin
MAPPPAKPVAPHVRAALAATAQAKPSPVQSRTPAAHVQAATAAVAQPRRHPGGGQPPAAHVQAAILQAKPAAPVPCPRPAPHVQRAMSHPVAGPGGAPLQAKPAPHPAGIGVLQPAQKRKLDEIQGELNQNPGRVKRRRKEVKRDGMTRTDSKKFLQGVERQEEKERQEAEKKRQQNLEKFREDLERFNNLTSTGSIPITYVTGKGSQKESQQVTSLPISKEFMSGAYAKATLKDLDLSFFHVGPQHFVLQQGHDYMLVPLVPEGEGEYRREGGGPTFDALSHAAERAAAWLHENHSGKYPTLQQARGRVARDINRMAGGKGSRENYPIELMMGEGGLRSFAAVIRSDKARVKEATKYIEGVLKSTKKSFPKRYGGKKPIYVGTGEGSGSGPSRLREKAKEDPGEISEYSSDEEKKEEVD